MNTEVTIAGNTYRIGKLDALRQFHVVRRLAPIFAALGLTVEKLRETVPKPDSDAGAGGVLMELAGPVVDILAKMSDEDTEYILRTCLSVVRRQEGERWAPVQTGVTLQYQDITMETMVRLAVEVIKENLSGFFKQPAAASE